LYQVAIDYLLLLSAVHSLWLFLEIARVKFDSILVRNARGFQKQEKRFKKSGKKR
jgi:hypothetical protein